MHRTARSVRTGVVALSALLLGGCASAPVASATPPPVPSRAALQRPLHDVVDPTPRPVPPTPAPVIGTPVSEVLIPMPVFQQVMALDCETAALQMGLAALGHTYSQQTLFAPQNPDNTSPVLKPGTKIVLQWGNPYVRFVGKVNGSDLAPSGYGVYWPPILSIAQSHGAPQSVGHENFSAAEIYAALEARHPVLVWVETGWERPGSYMGTWTAWDGTRIHYSLIEHVVALSGVSPTQVRVNDPWKSGSQYWISKSSFELSWSDFNNMAVILQ
jgi:uncharacterized protein YvpB